MKGKTTLTLTDDATGRAVKRIEEHNMITNALRDIFRFPKSALIGGVTVQSAIGQYLPLYKHLLGGILLFENAIPENADEYALPDSFSLTGHAGDTYSGTSVTRGTLNQNETYATDDGYHFTWDFATDKANGVIRCVSLTNRLFGNIGVGTDSNDGCFFANPNSLTLSQASYCPTAVSGDGDFAGNFSHGIATFVKFKNNEIYLRRMQLPDPDNIKVGDTAEPYLAEEIHIPSAFEETGIDYMFFVNKTEKAIYFFQSWFNSDDTSELRYFSIDPNTCAVKNTGRLTVQRKVYSLKNAAVFGGRVYVMGDGLIDIYTLSGELLRRFSADIGTYSFLFQHGGCVFASVYKETMYVLQNCDADIGCAVKNDPYISCYSTDIHYPYSLNTLYNTAGKASIALNTSYLATINNLGEPLEKTDRYTLKVSYDIIN